MLESIDNIEVIIFDKKQGWRGYVSVWKQLKGKRFDALLHMQYAIRASIVTLGIKAKHKLGFDKIRSQDGQHWFTNTKVPSPEKTHVLDGLIAFNEVLGIPDCSPKWDLSYPESAGVWAQSHLLADKRNLVIVPVQVKPIRTGRFKAMSISSIMRTNWAGTLFLLVAHRLWNKS